MSKVLECSREAILRYLSLKGGEVYEKKEGSSYSGYLTEMYDDISKRTFYIDIRMTDLAMVVYRILPGIHATHKVYIPSLAKYIQDLKCELGMLAISRTYLDIVYRSEMCIKEVPVTVDAFMQVEEEALRIFRNHFENIQNLAQGKMLEVSPEAIKRDDDLAVTEVPYDREANYKRLEYYLEKTSGHNEVCRNMDEDSEVAYSCHVVSERNRFRLQYILRRDGFFVIKAFRGEKALVIHDAYKYGVADFLNDSNAAYEYGALHIGDEKDGLYCCMHTPLHGGVLGEDTIKFMERVVLLIIQEVIGAAEQLSVGVMPRMREDVLESVWGAAPIEKKCEKTKRGEGKIVYIGKVRRE